MLAGYPDRLQPLAWPVFGAFLAVALAIAATWMFLRCTGSGSSRNRSLRPAAHRAAAVLFPHFFIWLVLLHLLAVFVQGGSAINTERIRGPGQYLLQGKNGVWEVSRAEFGISWVLGYGCTVGAIFAGVYGAWLKWYTEVPARHEEQVEQTSVVDRPRE